MDRFSGSEPLVGEIVGLRTFRVDESGLVLPLYSNLSWYDGSNTATCAPPTGERQPHAHAVPSPDCECGFYAYATQTAASQNCHLRYVQAVVSCRGAVLAGTQGVRAEHARIDAIWLNPNVVSWTRKRVAARYPSARIYTDRSAMLAEHALSALELLRAGRAASGAAPPRGGECRRGPAGPRPAARDRAAPDGAALGRPGSSRLSARRGRGLSAASGPDRGTA